jgi:hypothetical protein
MVTEAVAPLELVPVTRTLKVPSGVPGVVMELLLLLPPHPATIKHNAKATKDRKRLLLRREDAPSKNTPPNIPLTLAHIPSLRWEAGRAAVCGAVVVIVRTVVPAFATDPTLNEQLALDGKPEQEAGVKLTVPAKLG